MVSVGEPVAGTSALRLRPLAHGIAWRMASSRATSMMATALFSCRFTKSVESSPDQERYSGSRFLRIRRCQNRAPEDKDSATEDHGRGVGGPGSGKVEVILPLGMVIEIP